MGGALVIKPLLPIHSRRVNHIFYEWIVVYVVKVIVYGRTSLSVVPTNLVKFAFNYLYIYITTTLITHITQKIYIFAW